jgi:hypothetical protein
MKTGNGHDESSDDLAVFVRQVRARSDENATALTLLHRQGLVSNPISTLRQELDSLVRVVYLLSIRNLDRRLALIRKAVRGDRWPVRDSEMVKLTSNLHGWARSVYAFGCGFIHLSMFHDHARRDPFRALPVQERSDILAHLRYYHGGPAGEDPSFEGLLPYLPRVFGKIQSNLECYLQQLEAGKSLDD